MSSVNPINATGANAIADQLLKAFDANKDGQLSTAEFTTVLSSMLNGARAAAPAAAAALDAAPGAMRDTAKLAGFNLSKLATSESPKYKFARAALDFDLGSVGSKVDAEALLNQMRPAFAREGLDVEEIKGDRIRITHEGQPVWVDVIRSASVGATAFQWLTD
jgi:hypothetical protein